MRRRQSPPAANLGVPERLREFRLEDWVDEREAPLRWWAEDRPSWYYLRARVAHLRAVRAWRAEHGVSVSEWDVLRGACDPRCRRASPHAHG